MIKTKKSGTAKKVIRVLIIVFILMNVISAFQAYKFTHFDTSPTAKSKKGIHYTLTDKISAIFFGVDNPRPENKVKPAHQYQVIKLKSNKMIEGWLIPASNSKGTVILFHGYGAEKSAMLDKAEEFLKLGYNAFLIDFMGAGNSEGNQTTIGYYEGEEVKTAYEYIKQQGEQHIILYGASMGAVAILKGMYDFKLQPQSIIIQSPFGTMYQTVTGRFNMLHIPPFPMADLLVLWGGIENGFWAFGHNPVDYAKKVTCPVLLLYGEQDIKVSRQEIDDIYKNIPTKKVLKTFPQAGHENLMKFKAEWEATVISFLNDSGK